MGYGERALLAEESEIIDGASFESCEYAEGDGRGVSKRVPCRLMGAAEM